MHPNIAWTFSSLNSDSLNDALLEKYVSVTLNKTDGFVVFQGFQKSFVP